MWYARPPCSSHASLRLRVFALLRPPTTIMTIDGGSERGGRFLLAGGGVAEGVDDVHFEVVVALEEHEVAHELREVFHAVGGLDHHAEFVREAAREVSMSCRRSSMSALQMMVAAMLAVFVGVQPTIPRTSLWPGSPKMRTCQPSRTNFCAVALGARDDWAGGVDDVEPAVIPVRA